MKRIIHKFKNQKILVLGDLMMDRYLWGHVSRISPEAPVPVVAVNKETSCLGGAGNVSQNLASLGALPLLVGVVGDDPAGQWIIQNTPHPQGIFVDKNQPTTIKTRIIAHQQQVVRVDQEKVDHFSASLVNKILAFIQKETFHGILISDYNKGLVSKSLMKKVLSYAQQNKIPVFVDPKVENFSFFTPVTLITPNHHEAEKIVHKPCQTDQEVESAGQKILSRISSQFLILKRGEQGMTVFAKNQKPIHIPTIAKEVFDVTGAGDTVIATASLALLSGADIRKAALLANTAAGIVVGKIGTASLTARELLGALDI